MTRTARNRFVAWLGIAAMWLAIVAPVVSQTLAARHASDDPQAVLCAVEAHASNAPRDAAHAGHHDAASGFDACAYCGLLAHHLPIAVGVAHEVASADRVTRVAMGADLGIVAAKSFNTARSRAPPAFS